MKKFGVFLAIAALLFVGGTAMSEDGVLIKGRHVQKCIDIPITSGVVATSKSALSLQMLSSTTTPGFAFNDYIPSLQWTDTHTSPVLFTFRVPEDYDGQPKFHVFATESAATTHNNILFQVMHNRYGTAADSAPASTETAVALDQTTANSTSVLELVPGDSDFQGMQYGDWITLKLWRSEETATKGAGTLEVKGIAFCYTPIGM